MTCKLVKGSRRTVRCVVSYAGSRKNFSIRARLSRKGAVLARRTSLVRGRSVVMKLTSKRKLRKGRYAVVLVVGNGQRDVTGAVTVR